MLALRNISKIFGGIIALSDVSFEIEAGDFVFLTGPSGAGKTTLLKIILGEVKPDKGTVFLNNQDLTKLSAKELPFLRQQIGVVFQDFKVLPDKTVRENIEIALAVVKVPKEEWVNRVREVLELTGLKERENLFPSQLSGGELQRVSLARALVVNPKIILADEPTGNLDWETADAIMDIFVKVNSEGKTVIVSTHNLEMLKKHHKRTIELKNGKLIKDTKKENKT